MSLTHICEQISQLTSEINDAQQRVGCEETASLVKQLFDLLQQLPKPSSAISVQNNLLLQKTLSEALKETQATTTRYQSWQQDVAVLLEAFSGQSKP